jgi:hypothetical protein
MEGTFMFGRFFLSIMIAVVLAVPAAADLASWELLDTLTVPATGGVVYTDPLSLGATYRFEASGTYYANDLIYADAEYSERDGGAWQDLVPNYTEHGEGLLELRINNQFVEWGPFHPDHIYNLIRSDVGGLVAFDIYDLEPMSNNSGSLTVNVYTLVPAPAGVLLGMLGLGMAGLTLREHV